MDSALNLRIKNLYAQLKQKNLDGLIVSDPANISYLVKFPSRDSYFLACQKENAYFTDSRYIEEVRQKIKGVATLKKVDGSVFKGIANLCLVLSLKRIGFEEKILPYAGFKKIEAFFKRKIDLVPTCSIIEQLRQVKEGQEIEKIKRAVEITSLALKFAKKIISPARKEIEIAGELERFIRYHGGNSSAFDIIVASGPNSSFPHHQSSSRKIKNHELVLVDLGVDYQGYKSDLTRVFFLGKISSPVARIYEIVLAAQAKAIARIKPGSPINTIDKAARQYIAQKGYGGFFSHNLGHGVGLEVHEEPRISSKEISILKTGMVFTVEPAIYLSNRFGVRLEDMVLVAQKGCVLLSGSIDK